MKIKTLYEWEEEDLGNGRWVTRQSSPPSSDNVSFMCSVTYKLGFIMSVDHQKYAKVSVCDGMVLQFNSKADLIKHLNTDTHGYRPTTPEDYRRMSEHVERQCTQAKS